MVTKQQQLEWLANNLDKWRNGYDFAVVDKHADGGFYVRWPSVCSSGISKREWQQERDKMQQQEARKPEQPAPDNSWYERGEFPPVGCECSAMCYGQWVTVEVLRHRVNNVGMNVAAVMNCNSFNVFWATDFRPLRTEREKAINEMVASIGDEFKFEGYDLHTRITRSLSEFIYDAGYRKVNP